MKATDFRYPLVIEGTPEQIRVLRNKLLAIGYPEAIHPNTISEYTKYLVTQYFAQGMDYFDSVENRTDRTKVSADDEELVLALAAMRSGDEPHVGEWMVALRNHHDQYTQGKLYKTTSVIGLIYQIDDRGEKNGWSASNFRKATAAEIINHFKNMNNQESNGVAPTKTFTVDEGFIKEAHAAACANWKTKIESKFPDLFTYRVGQRFDRVGAEWMLASVGPNLVSLISLETGNRFREGVVVQNIGSISQAEFSEIGNPSFKPIPKNQSV